MTSAPHHHTPLITGTAQSGHSTLPDETLASAEAHCLAPRALGTVIAALAYLVASVAVLGQAKAAGDAEINACPTDRNVPKEIAARLDRTLTTVIDGKGDSAVEIGFAPGAEMLIRAPGWTYHRSVGTGDMANAAPLDCGRPFQIGSNTKMMTATILMQMVEDGALTLDDPLALHLPSIAASLPFGDAITIRQLANHTSGVFRYTDNAPNGAPGIMEGALADPALLAKGYTPEDLVQFAIANGTSNFSPGAEGQWAYSNTGYILKYRLYPDRNDP